DGFGPGCGPRPYRSYPGMEPEHFMPAPTPVEPAPVTQPARAPIFRGGLLKSMMSRRSEPAVDPVIPTSPPAAASAPTPQLKTTVDIVPAQPRMPDLIPDGLSGARGTMSAPGGGADLFPGNFARPLPTTPGVTNTDG